MAKSAGWADLLGSCRASGTDVKHPAKAPGIQSVEVDPVAQSPLVYVPCLSVMSRFESSVLVAERVSSPAANLRVSRLQGAAAAEIKSADAASAGRHIR